MTSSNSHIAIPIILAISIVMAFPMTARGQVLTVEAPPAGAKIAAGNGLLTLKAIVMNDNDHAAQLGFKNAAEVQALTNANLESPFPWFWIRLDKLAQLCGATIMSCSSLTDPVRSLKVVKLIEPFTEFLYPISVGNDTKSSLTVLRKSAHDWLATEWGSAQLIRQVVKWKSGMCLIVSIPGLNRTYLAGPPSGGACGPPIPGHLLTLRALSTDPVLHIAEGDTINAWVAFLMLQSLADAVRSSQAPR
jgi:hypothetical protein